MTGILDQTNKPGVAAAKASLAFGNWLRDAVRDGFAVGFRVVVELVKVAIHLTAPRTKKSVYVSDKFYRGRDRPVAPAFSFPLYRNFTHLPVLGPSRHHLAAFEPAVRLLFSLIIWVLDGDVTLRRFGVHTFPARVRRWSRGAKGEVSAKHTRHRKKH
jgi:hypothetical protein